MPTENTLRLLSSFRESLASEALTERQAKLYSQRVRRSMGREGLTSFSASDASTHLDEAIMLIQGALIERQSNANEAWADAAKRAGELFEWLSQRELRPEDTPTHLLSAAAYQVAGFPAMALGVLRSRGEISEYSPLLRSFLEADFPSTLEAARRFWADQLDLYDQAPREAAIAIEAIRHTVMCIGTLCAYFRNGDDELVERALEKLERITATFAHSRDAFSYLLARLTAAVARRYIRESLWRRIRNLQKGASAQTSQALNQFGRLTFVNRRSLVWTAQGVGIDNLSNNSSFVLCTPTGSGKTMVATLAVVQSLFADTPLTPASLEGLEGGLILYLVPSRALAAEVESRFALDLHGIAPSSVVVTGLYGGIDWGPTDAWISGDSPTIVICTFEKADALIRYLGVLFLHRVRLVVIDEAHMVEQDPGRLETLQNSTSRSFRLEQLGTRLFNAQETFKFRVVALSAVAARAAPALARWVTGEKTSQPTVSEHRSTRQMFGRIEVTAKHDFSIHYDLMDGRSLRFQEGRVAATPYIPSPFPPMPPSLPNLEGPEKGMRVPTLWAALQLAAERADGLRPSVLISLTQHVDAFASTCADQLDAWPKSALPNFHAFDNEDARWKRCLAAAADYFTEQSVEYRLLRRGIAVHHGKMPPLLARRLKVLIDCGYVRVVIATSTLSEGVNLPVNYLLIPSVFRGQQRLPLQEFLNLIGRVGRPGVATEGHALVVLAEHKRGQTFLSRQWQGYNSLVVDIEANATALVKSSSEDSASSALAHLLAKLHEAWASITRRGTEAQFYQWLEKTAVTEDGPNPSAAVEYLDSLDSFLIASIQELEELRGTALSRQELEPALTRIWQRTYAFAATADEARLRRIWLTRGRVIQALYPDSNARKQIYKSSLSPRSAATLVERAAQLKAKLVNGLEYSVWEPEQRFQFLREVISDLSDIPSFYITTQLGRKRNFDDWPTLLRWWLAKDTLDAQPKPQDITSWYDFVSNNFIYRSTWGLGSLLGLLLDVGDPPIRPLEIDDWPRSGLPWVAFWVKELITWGTLEPVSAFALARGGAIDRPEAHAIAAAYYNEQPRGTDANELLNPRRVRDWVNARQPTSTAKPAAGAFEVPVVLEKPASSFRKMRLSVAPIAFDGKIVWIDAAGYTVARGEKPMDLPEPTRYEFELRVDESRVTGAAYRPYA